MATWGSTVKSRLWALLKACAPLDRHLSEKRPFPLPACLEPCFPPSKCYGADISAHSDSA